MAIIGFNSQGASSLNPQTNWDKKMLRVGQLTASANEQVISLHYYGRANSAAQIPTFGLFRVDAGDGGTGNHTLIQRFQIPAGNAGYDTDQLQSYTLPTPFQLESGVTYAVGFILGSIPNGVLRYDSEADSAYDLSGSDIAWDNTAFTANASTGKISAYLTTNTSGATDSTAPTWSSAPAVTATTENGHTIGFTASEGGTVYAVRMTNGATAPADGAAVKTLHAGGVSGDVLEVQSVDVVGGVPFSVTFSTGSASTAYDYYLVAEDHISTPNVQAAATLVEGTTDAGAGDVTPPTFSVAPAVTPSSVGGTVTATIDETGDIFYVVVADGATAPSSSEVIAGTGAGGSGELATGSALAGTSINDAFTGLSASTAYDLYIVARDDEGTPNVQASPTLVNFTTSAPAVNKGVVGSATRYAALVPDGTAVNWSVWDGDPDLAASSKLVSGAADTGIFTSGVPTIDNESVGAVDDTVWVSMSYTISSVRYSFTFSTTVVDLNA